MFRWLAKLCISHFPFSIFTHGAASFEFSTETIDINLHDIVLERCAWFKAFPGDGHSLVFKAQKFGDQVSTMELVSLVNIDRALLLATCALTCPVVTSHIIAPRFLGSNYRN